MLQLVAGSEIDTLFGAKLGLSTLAAAGLGNMVSDVAGVSMANRIEVGLLKRLQGRHGQCFVHAITSRFPKAVHPSTAGESGLGALPTTGEHKSC